MISTKEDYLYYLEQDRIALGVSGHGFRNRLRNALFPNPIWRFQRIMRKLEYLTNVKGGGFFGFGTAGDIVECRSSWVFRFRSIRSARDYPLRITGLLSSIQLAESERIAVFTPV